MLLKRLITVLLLIITFSAATIPFHAKAAGTTPFAVIKLTSPIRRNAKAKLVIKTTPNAKCHLMYRMPSGRYSTAKGLGIKYADKQGKCSWTWTIGPSTKTGTGQLIITINETFIKRLPIIIK